jgi:hypothetical protein
VLPAGRWLAYGRAAALARRDPGHERPTRARRKGARSDCRGGRGIAGAVHSRRQIRILKGSRMERQPVPPGRHDPPPVAAELTDPFTQLSGCDATVMRQICAGIGMGCGAARRLGELQGPGWVPGRQPTTARCAGPLSGVPARLGAHPPAPLHGGRQMRFFDDHGATPRVSCRRSRSRTCGGCSTCTLTTRRLASARSAASAAAPTGATPSTASPLPDSQWPTPTDGDRPIKTACMSPDARLGKQPGSRTTVTANETASQAVTP